MLPVLAELPGEWAGRRLYENWYLARGQFLHGVRIGDSQAVAARIYVTLLGRDDIARQRLHSLASGADSIAVRAASAEALAANWPDDAETAVLLRALAIDSQQDVYVRHHALRALAARAPGDTEVRGLLVDCAQTGATEVRGTAVQLLAADWLDVDTVDLLRDIGAGIGEVDPGVRAVAVRGLAEAWRTDTDVLGWLWERTAQTEPVRARVAAVQALAAHWGSDPDVLSWLEQHACEADEPEFHVRLAAVRALAACWPELTRTAELLMAKATAGGDTVSEVRRAAVEALALSQRNERTAALLRLMATEDSSGGVRSAAMRALVTNWADQPSTVKTLERLLIGHPDPDPFVLAGAATALAELLPGDHRIAARLRSLAEQDRRSDVRAAALRALAAHHQADPATAAWLYDRSARDPAAWVRGAAVEVLSDGWHDDDTLARLRAVGLRPTADKAEIRRDAVACRVAVRSVAAGWPTEIGTHAWLLHRAANDEYPEASQAALELLAANDKWRALPETVAVLRTAASAAGHPQTRETAIQVLAAIQQGNHPAGAGA